MQGRSKGRRTVRPRGKARQRCSELAAAPRPRASFTGQDHRHDRAIAGSKTQRTPVLEIRVPESPPKARAVLKLTANWGARNGRTRRSHPAQRGDYRVTARPFSGTPAVLQL